MFQRTALIISGLIAVVVLRLWSFRRLANGFGSFRRSELDVFWLVAAILVSSAYYFVRTVVTTTNIDRFPLERLRVSFLSQFFCIFLPPFYLKHYVLLRLLKHGP